MDEGRYLPGDQRGCQGGQGGEPSSGTPTLRRPPDSPLHATAGNTLPHSASAEPPSGQGDTGTLPEPGSREDSPSDVREGVSGSREIQTDSGVASAPAEHPGPRREFKPSDNDPALRNSQPFASGRDSVGGYGMQRHPDENPGQQEADTGYKSSPEEDLSQGKLKDISPHPDPGAVLASHPDLPGHTPDMLTSPGARDVVAPFSSNHSGGAPSQANGAQALSGKLSLTHDTVLVDVDKVETLETSASCRSRSTTSPVRHMPCHAKPTWKHLFCVICIIFLLIIISLVIGIAVYLTQGFVTPKLIKFKQEPTSPATAAAAATAVSVTSRMTLQVIPLLEGANSSAMLRSATFQRFLRKTFEYQMDHLYSPIYSEYNKASVLRISTETGNDDILVECRLDFLDSLTPTSGALARRSITTRMVQETWASNLGPRSEFGIFLVKTSSFHLADQVTSTHAVTTFEHTTLESVTTGLFLYDDTLSPNQDCDLDTDPDNLCQFITDLLYGQLNLTEECAEQFASFWCAVSYPPCVNGVKVPPCLSFCQLTQDRCLSDRDELAERGFVLDSCDQYVDSSDPKVCTAPAGSRCNLELKGVCKGALPYDRTVANYRLTMETMRQLRDLTQLFHCYEHMSLFLCAVLYPKCAATNRKSPSPDPLAATTIPTCRSLCLAAKENCGFFLELVGADWAADVDCEQLPESMNESICIGGAAAALPFACDPDSHQCDGTRCIPLAWICDDVPDCQDRSDELHCAKCPPGAFTCAGGLCIAANKVCDGVNDCYQGEDEANCVRLSGSNGVKGLVEVQHAGTWSPMCFPSWSETKGNDICNGVASGLVLLSSQTRPGERASLPNNSSSSSCVTAEIVCGIEEGCHDIPLSRPLAAGEATQVTPPDWPWLVSLNGGPRLTYLCTGALISPQWVLTAAHCIGRKLTTNSWTVMAGHSRRHSYSKWRERRGISEIHVHPHFEAYTLENDIALLKLDAPFDVNDHIYPVCLPEQWEWPVMPEGAMCYLVGWGKVFQEDTDFSPTAKLTELTVASLEHCKAEITKSVGEDFPLANTSFCASGRLGADACSGDSGGLVMCRRPASAADIDDVSRHVMVPTGITSWGVQCGDPDIPGVYTLIDGYLDWLSTIVDKY